MKKAVCLFFSSPFESEVFEVNCSSQRSGCHVLSQLREATQSHQVGVLGKDPLKPTYLNNYSSAAKAEMVPGRTQTTGGGHSFLLNMNMFYRLLCFNRKNGAAS